MEKSPPWAVKAFGPTARYLDMLLIDHGIFRVVYLNRHRIGKNGKAWRSAQPAPHQVRAIAQSGVKTIINLRGQRTCGSFWLEEDACRRHGIALKNFTISSRAAPSKETLLAAKELFETVEYPILLHCKSGADRAGLMSVLYAFMREDEPIEVARRQLSLRYGHIRQADTGVLDHFLDRYVADNARSPIDFWTWVETVYDPDEIKRSFHAKGWANRLVNTVLDRE